MKTERKFKREIRGKALDGILNKNRVITNYLDIEPVQRVEPVKVYKVQNDIKKRGRIRKALGILALEGASMAVLLSIIKCTPKESISEAIAQRSFKNAYENARIEYSREAYLSGEDEQVPEEYRNVLQNGEIIGMINKRYAAFSENSAKYLDNGERVPTQDLVAWVKAYQPRQAN